MPLRFENWSNNLLRLTMKKKYEEAELVFPPEGSLFLLKVFLEPPFEDSAQELKAFMQVHHIPETYLDTTRVGRRGGNDPSRLHLDLYGDLLYDKDGTLVWTEEKIRSEGYVWKSGDQVWPGGEGNKTILK